MSNFLFTLLGFYSMSLLNTVKLFGFVGKEKKNVYETHLQMECDQSSAL